MRKLSEVLLVVDRVKEPELTMWIERGWIIPQRGAAAEPVFSDIDVARIELIADLHHDLAVDDETMPLVLSLLDQIHGLRRQLYQLTCAIREQPEDIRQAIVKRLGPHLRS